MRIIAKITSSLPVCIKPWKSLHCLLKAKLTIKKSDKFLVCLIGQIIARVLERAGVGRRHSREMRWKERLRALRRKQGRPERQLLDIPLCSSRITLQLENMTTSKIGPRINCFVVCRSWCLSLAVFTKFQTVYTVWGHGAGLDCLPTDLWGLRA